MGVVWSAVQLVTRKPVALKVLRAAHTADKGIVQRFLREARAACAVRHPNVVEIHDVILVEDGSPVMVMDLLEGESLGQRLERERSLPLVELATILLPVVSAVGTAHGVGIVHRDLKPDNIFLSKTATGTVVKVLDFGIAKLTATDGDAAATGGLTGTGAMLGTPFYMAPEQIYGEKDVDHRTDIWALGVMLYECLAGVRPTQSDSIGQILKIVTRDGIKPLREVCPALPPNVLDLVDRMLSVERTKRPSMQEVGEVLALHANLPLGQTGPRAIPSPLVTSSVGDVADAVAVVARAPATLSSTTTTVGSSSQKTHRSTIALIGIAAASALGALVFLGARSLRSPTDTSLAPSSAPSAVVHAGSEAPVATAAAPTASDPTPVASVTPTPTVSARRPEPILKPVASVTAPPPALSASATATATAHAPGGVVDKPPF